MGQIRRRAATLVGSAVVFTTIAACDEPATVVPSVVVPNDIIGDLVSRVGCVEALDVIVGEPEADRTPILVLTLDPASSTADAGDGAPFLLSVPAAVTTVDRLGEPDAWVWTDPIRFSELAFPVAGALAQSGQFDAELLDRCVARIEAEMELLDEELFSATQAVPDTARVMDISLPGTIYFANRYGFGVDDSPAAVDAGVLMSMTDLDGAESYDQMMRSRVDRLVEVVGP